MSKASARQVSAPVVVFVIGMHRCGTSVLTGALVKSGYGGPFRQLPAAHDNPRGTFESPEVVDLNERLLGQAGRQWFHTRPVKKIDPAAEIETASHLLQHSFELAPAIIVKDPRISLVLPFWLQSAKKAGLVPKVVIACRHPRATARSLNIRDGFETEHSAALWLRYMLLAERLSRGVARAIVDVDEFVMHPSCQIRSVEQQLNLKPLKGLGETISDFVDSELMWRPEKASISLPFDAEEAYSLIIKIADHGPTHAELKRLAEIESRLDCLTPALEKSINQQRQAILRRRYPITCRLSFRTNGTPRTWLRLLLFRNGSISPRSCLRRVVYKKNGALRPVFHDWMIKYQQQS